MIHGGGVRGATISSAPAPRSPTPPFRVFLGGRGQPPRGPAPDVRLPAGFGRPAGPCPAGAGFETADRGTDGASAPFMAGGGGAAPAGFT
jgi:hypothetical protein